MNPVKDNPNATVGGGSSIAGGVLVIWLAGLFGYAMDNYVAVTIAGALGALALFIGRNGIRGAAERIWRGGK